MKYKLFGIDLDGTLLSKNKKISTKNLQAINRYINAGGVPVIITGRSFISARTYNKKIEEYTQTKLPYLVGFNGAYIQNLKTNEIIKNTIDKKITSELWDLAIEKKCGIWIYPDAKQYEKIVLANKKWLAIFAKSSREVELQKSKSNIALSSYKINIMSFSPSKIKAIRKYLISKYSNDLEISYTHPLLLEITKKNINKGIAILTIAKELQIDKQNIAAVGDSGNDVPMLKVSGLSFGLKSRSQELRNNANIYLTNKNNAVAKIVNNYLINKNVEMIVSDLDGTLLDDYTKLVDQDTKITILKAIKKKNCKFTIATGRGLDDSLLVYKNLGLKNTKWLYVVGCNGAFIYDCDNKNYIYKNFINPELSKKLCDLFYKIFNSKHIGKMGAQICINHDFSKKFQATCMINKDIVLNVFRKKTKYFLKNNWQKKEIFELHKSFDFKNIFKIIFFCENNEDRMRLLGSIISANLPIEISSSGLSNIELMAKNDSKGNAIKFLTTYLKIDNDNVMVIGDEKNDISMLNMFNKSVTLKSSKMDVKKAAHYVIDAKPSEIVNKAIKKFVFDNE